VKILTLMVGEPDQGKALCTTRVRLKESDGPMNLCQAARVEANRDIQFYDYIPFTFVCASWLRSATHSIGGTYHTSSSGHGPWLVDPKCLTTVSYTPCSHQTSDQSVIETQHHETWQPRDDCDA